MITHGAFPVEPWTIRESKLDLDVLAQTESVFALSNGHIGLRANLDEGEPHGLPGTYLNAVHELRPLDYGESVYGNPNSSQTVINVANGKVIRLLVDDEPFDVRYGSLEEHERVLDMRAGTLDRHAKWTSPAGRQIDVRSTRMVSFTERAVAAICYDVTPVNGRVQVVLQSDLVVNEPMPERANDPRSAGSVDAPFVPEMHGERRLRTVLVHSTRRSQLRVGAGMDHIIECPADLQTETVSHPMLGRVTVTVALDPGQTLRITKFLAYGWSAQRSLPAIEAQVEAALTAAVATGWDGLLKKQREFLDVYWSRADVQIDGADDVQQAVRFGLFHVLQATLPRRASRDPGQGTDRTRVRRAFVLGHRDVRVAGGHLHLARGGPGCVALAAFHARYRARERGRHGVERRRLRLADDRRAGMLGLLAGRRGRVPHQRRHRVRRDPPGRGDRRRRLRA